MGADKGIRRVARANFGIEASPRRPVRMAALDRVVQAALAAATSEPARRESALRRPKTRPTAPLPAAHRTRAGSGPRTGNPPPSPTATGSAPVTSSTRSAPSPLRRHASTMSASSDSSTTSGKSLNCAPLSRSTAWIQTSRVRIHTVSDAGTVRPCAVRTGAAQRDPGRCRHFSSSRATVWSNRFRKAAADSVAPSLISRSRWLGRRVHRCLDAGRRPVHQSAQRRGVVADVGDQVLAGPAVQQRVGFQIVVAQFGEALREERGAAPRDQSPLGQVQVVKAHHMPT